MSEPTHFFEIGYEAGAADREPAPSTGISFRKVPSPMTNEQRLEYLAGWTLAQAELARAKRLGWTIGDPGFAPIEKKHE
jgi:hypothetical protein